MLLQNTGEKKERSVYRAELEQESIIAVSRTDRNSSISSFSRVIIVKNHSIENLPPLRDKTGETVGTLHTNMVNYIHF